MLLSLEPLATNALLPGPTHSPQPRIAPAPASASPSAAAHPVAPPALTQLTQAKLFEERERERVHQLVDELAWARSEQAPAAHTPGSLSEHLFLAVSHLSSAIGLIITCKWCKPRLLGLAARGDEGGKYRELRDKDRPILEEDWRDSGACIIFPPMQWKTTWDLVILAGVAYSAAVVPFRISFNSVAEGWVYDMEITLTICFLTDCFLNFNTAYLVQDHWVVSRAQIAKRYLKGWCWIDAPSSVPVELIHLLVQPDVEGNDNLTMLRFLRLFRMLRLLRLLKVR